MFGGSLQVTAPPLEQTQLPHGVAVTSSEHQKAPVVPQVGHVTGGQTYDETTLPVSSGGSSAAAETPEMKVRESTGVNSGSGLGGSCFSTSTRR